jgi:hypothetical protein
VHFYSQRLVQCGRAAGAGHRQKCCLHCNALTVDDITYAKSRLRGFPVSDVDRSMLGSAGRTLNTIAGLSGCSNIID